LNFAQILFYFEYKDCREFLQQYFHLLKIPKSKIKDIPSRIVVELNPVDEYGNPTKKRGIILRNLEELKEFKNLINNEKLENFLKAIDNINPKISKRFKPSKEAIEI
jgi:hypothetical protein